MNKLLSFGVLLLLSGVQGLRAGPNFPAGKTWTETQYFVEKFSASEAIPRPAPDWKMYSRTVVESAGPLIQIDQQLGAETPLRTWIRGDAVVQRDPDGRLTVSPKRLFDLPAKPDVSWTKDEKPVAKIRRDGMQVLVFDVPEKLGGGRVWIDEATGEALALWRRKFVTVMEVGPASSPPLQLPPEARAAIEARSKRAKVSVPAEETR